MSDQLAARIRTLWPLLIGHLAAFLAATAAHRFGLTPSVSGIVEAALLEILGLAGSAAVWQAGVWLEHQQNPILASLGRWLVSAGQHIGPPAYGQQPETLQQTTDYHPDGSVKQITSVTTWPAGR